MLAGGFEYAALNIKNEALAVAGEELYFILGGFVGAEKTVFFVVAAAVNGGGENIVKSENGFCAGVFKNTLGAGAGVNIAGKDGVGVVKDCFCVVCKDDFNLCAAFAD